MAEYTVVMVAACPFPANRGTPSRILRVSEALVERGHEVHVVTYPLQDETIPRAESLHVHRTTPPIAYRKLEPGPSVKKPIVDASLTRTVAEVVREKSIDVLHGHHIEGLACALPASRIWDVPVVYDAHTHVSGELGEYYAIAERDPISELLERAERAVVGRASGAIVVSEELREIVAGYGLRDDVIWSVPTGTNAETLRRLADESRVTRGSLGLDDDQPVVVYTGTLKPYQGLDHLLGAVRSVLKRHPQARLLLVGSGDDDGLRTTARDLGIDHVVRFCGAVPFEEVPGYLDLADVAVLPRTEATGAPQKLTNYMAMGLPTVAFETSASPLTHLEHAYLAEDGNVEAFADGISTLLEDDELRERLGEGARRKAAEFEWDELATTVETAYDAVTADG